MYNNTVFVSKPSMSLRSLGLALALGASSAACVVQAEDSNTGGIKVANIDTSRCTNDPYTVVLRDGEQVFFKSPSPDAINQVNTVHALSDLQKTCQQSIKFVMQSQGVSQNEALGLINPSKDHVGGDYAVYTFCMEYKVHPDGTFWTSTETNQPQAILYPPGTNPLGLMGCTSDGNPTADEVGTELSDPQAIKTLAQDELLHAGYDSTKNICYYDVASAGTQFVTVCASTSFCPGHYEYVDANTFENSENNLPPECTPDVSQNAEKLYQEVFP